MKCVYCVEDKPLSSFTKVEHVMPQSFGLFTNNLTLVNTVCDDCNQYFGDNLEIVRLVPQTIFKNLKTSRIFTKWNKKLWRLTD